MCVAVRGPAFCHLRAVPRNIRASSPSADTTTTSLDCVSCVVQCDFKKTQAEV